MWLELGSPCPALARELVKSDDSIQLQPALATNFILAPLPAEPADSADAEITAEQAGEDLAECTAATCHLPRAEMARQHQHIRELQRTLDIMLQ